MSRTGNYKMKPKITHTGKLLDYADFVSYSPNYLESGSAAGESINRALKAGFKDVRSCELDLRWYRTCFDRYADDDRVKLYYGESIDKWSSMLSAFNEPCVLFLDAHPAGPGTAGHNEFEEGDGRYGQDAIITRELEIILAHRPDHLVIIDDINGINPEAEKYIQMCLAVNPNYTFEFWDENLSNNPNYYYKSKILVCRP